MSLDCGDNSCYFALNKTGMRTNGGCRCFSEAGFHRSLIASACEMLPELLKLRAERDELKALIDQATRLVVPGEVDTGDAFRKMLSIAVVALEKISAPTYGTEICNSDEENNKILADHFFLHQRIARQAIVKIKGKK